ncbi:MAG: T9SS type A sorting domain-containing protein [Bacteroidetes bacterium]|nr:T9SS type A sorting domain-containing protein [Bacteroidota bacterium]
MKTKQALIAIFLLLIGVSNSFSQISNSGFELWNNMGTYDDPQNWWTLNSMSAGAYYPITKSTDHYPSSVGTYSVRIENNPALLPNLEAFGVIATDPPFGPAFAVSGHPTSFTGYYKFLPQNGDTMYVNLLLYQSGTVVAFAKFTDTATASNWTSFNISISAYATADSGLITLAAFNAETPVNIPHGNSVLYIDNLSFDSLISSVIQIGQDVSMVTIYPNPVKNELNISLKNNHGANVIVYDLMGKMVKELTFNQETITIDLTDLQSGLYLYRINDEKGKLIDSGKLIAE